MQEKSAKKSNDISHITHIFLPHHNLTHISAPSFLPLPLSISVSLSFPLLIFILSFSPHLHLALFAHSYKTYEREWQTKREIDRERERERERESGQVDYQYLDLVQQNYNTQLQCARQLHVKKACVTEHWPQHNNYKQETESSAASQRILGCTEAVKHHSPWRPLEQVPAGSNINNDDFFYSTFHPPSTSESALFTGIYNVCAIINSMKLNCEKETARVKTH